MPKKWECFKQKETRLCHRLRWSYGVSGRLRRGRRRQRRAHL